jgi:hypothetical protein
VLYFDSGDPATAGQVGRWGTLFQQPLEHGLWTKWHGESVGEDHDWSSGGIHVDSSHTRAADPDWVSISIAVRERAGGNADTDSRTGAGSFTGSTSRFTGCEPVGDFCGAVLRALFLKTNPAIMAASF